MNGQEAATNSSLSDRLLGRGKALLEVVDLLVKIAVMVIVFAFFGVEKERIGIEKDRQETNEKLVSAIQTQQTTNLAVAEKLIALLFDEKNKCISEDQFFLIEFLIETNNAYNRVSIDKKAFFGISAARRDCATGGSSVARDAQKSGSVDNDQLPVVTTAAIPMIQDKLKAAGVTVVEAPQAREQPQGYVACGPFDGATKSFRNFAAPVEAVGKDGTIKANAIITARWPVYLRANMTNTEDGGNPILGVIQTATCVQVLASFPSVRGQTWAAVKLADCS